MIQDFHRYCAGRRRRIGWAISPGARFLVLLAVSGLAAALWAGQSQSASSLAPPQAQERAGSSKDAAQQPAAEQTENHISPAEAKELLRSVDEIVQFASKDTNLAIRRPVKRALVSRDEVRKYVEERIQKDEGGQRLRRSETVLKKFGLLPRDFDLQTFLVALLREQVAGFYDPKSKTVNLLDWVDPEVQRPVLAHELTHALQDQGFNLENWMKHGPSKSAGKHSDRRGSEAEDDEQVAAREAVVEGQAMVVLTDYVLAPTGQTILNAPLIVEAMKQGIVQGSPLFNKAPLYLREALMFPYTYGLDFERTLLEKGGREKAFVGVLQQPPQSTRQVMQPSTYLAGERIEPLAMPDFARLLGKDYERVDTGAIGEFDVSVLLKQFAGEDLAKRLWPQWRGGYYYAARRRDATQALPALIYVSRWAAPGQATQFAGVYASSLQQKYKQLAVVRAPQQPTNTSTAAIQVAIADTASHWNTEDGPVWVQQRGDLVIVIEGFDETTGARLRDSVVQTAVTPSQ